MKAFPLLLVATLLAILLFPIGILTTLIRSVIRWKRISFFAYTAESALSLALSIDLMGNVVGRDLLELLLTTSSPARYRFGKYTETISAVLGHNKALGTLSRLGRGLSGLLNFIDPGHVERAAGMPVIPAPDPLQVLIRAYIKRYWKLVAAINALLILIQLLRHIL